MKRDPALVGLSHDHHNALFTAMKLRRATEETAGAAREALAAYWEDHGRTHFRLEEEVLYPAYAGHGDAYDELIARAMCDHIAIRQMIAAVLKDPNPPLDRLHALGDLMNEHVRLEERKLFPLIEQALPAPELAALAIALQEP
ncbi:MAG TPA: hemerythrin domain-containing protein [Solirubrobacteraceae bacterium]